MQSTATRRHQSGFSLIELMTTVAVLAIILAIAFPSFTSVVNNNRLSSEANALVGAIQYARSEAVRLNQRVALCQSADQITCSNNALWTGWIIYVDRGVAPNATNILQVGTIRAQVEVRNSSNLTGRQISFRPDGVSRSSASGNPLMTANFSVCMPTTRPTDNVRLVALQFGSRVSTSSSNGSGACAVPGNPS